MKNKTANINAKNRKITRKQAIQKVGITALTAASIMFLSTKQSAAASTLPGGPGGGWPI
jgi:hypothetical protein